MFYSDFSNDYEEIFPFREKNYTFLKEFLSWDTARILDIGCASGEYCGRFYEEGYTIEGIDLDKAMIQSAREKYKAVKFEVLNLMDVQDLNSSYDFIYSLGNVMAHISKTDFTKFLMALKKKLNAKGIWIYQVLNWDYILGQKEFIFPLIETQNKTFHRTYTKIEKDSLLFNTKLIDKNTKEIVFSDQVEMYPISSSTYIELHEKLGFKLKGHYSDFSKSFFEKKIFSADIYIFEL